MACLDENRALAFVEGELGEEERGAIEEHLDACADCRALMAALARSSLPPAAGPAEASLPRLARGATAGRYVVLQSIGSGAMGVVYAAYDPELHREVALKLLRGHQSEEPEAQQRRLLREAQAMARLAHPNVLSVFDVGRLGDQVFVAMERITGETLREWLVKSRPRNEVLRLFIDAGKGLAAAHAAGIVHRDFKPDNVLIGADGRPRVTDFGLARLEAATEPPNVSSLVAPMERTEGAESVNSLARGWRVGTPAYMAPEVMAGQPADARSDQYSFCVALFEALHGRRPEEGSAESNGPTWLSRVLMRGLSANPEARYGAMDGLLTALQRGLVRPLRRRALLAGTAALLLVGTALGLQARRNSCSRAGDAITSVWNEEARAKAQVAFTRAVPTYGAGTWSKAERVLERFATEWRAARTDSCEQSRAHPDTEEVAGWRALCLQDRKEALSALLQLFQSADAQVVEKSVFAATLLEAPRSCENLVDLASRVKAPEQAQQRHDVESLRSELAHVKARFDAGKYAEARAQAESVHRRSEKLHYRPLEAESLFLLASAQLEESKRFDDVLKLLHRAAFAAEAAGSARESVRINTAIASVLAEGKAQYEQALHHTELASAQLERLGEDITLRARLMTVRGQIHALQERHEEARAELEEAMRLYEKAHGPDTVELTDVLEGLSLVLWNVGKADESREASRKAVEVSTRALGASHPRVGVAETQLARALTESGKHEEASALFRSAIQKLEAGLGAEHEAVSRALYDSAVLQLNLGRFEECLPLARRAAAGLAKGLGADHPDAAAANELVGTALLALERPQEALPIYRQVLVAREVKLGARSTAVAISLWYLANAQQRLGQFDEAILNSEKSAELIRALDGPDNRRRAYPLLVLANCHQERRHWSAALSASREALRILEKGLGPEHPMLGSALVVVSRSLLELHRPGEAVGLQERALRLLAKKKDVQTLAEARFLLARALDASGRDPARARRLAAEALTELSGQPDNRPTLSLRSRIRRWQADRATQPVGEG